MSRTRFSVDDVLCIGCRLCEERAPENMEMARGSSAAVVRKQPESDEEEEACREAAEYCPTGGLIPAEPAAAEPKEESEARAPSQ